MATDRYTRGYDGDRQKIKRMGTLWGDVETGEGDVTLRLEGMCDETPLFRLDVLKDWIDLLQKEYDITYEEWQSELKRIASKRQKEQAKNEVSI